MPHISSKFIATLIFVAVFLWIGSGFFPSMANKPEDDGTKTVEKTASIAPKVGITKSEAKNILQEVQLYGTTMSYRKVNIKSQTHGKVEKISVLEGGRVKEGDIILSLEVEDRKKILQSAEALLAQRRLEYNVAKSLKNSGHQSKTKLSESYANLQSAVANLYKTQTAYDEIFIKAPFNGIVQELYVEEGDYLHQSGEQVATVIDDSKILAVARIPENKIAGIKIGNNATIKTVSGIETVGFVSYISKVADATTRTFRVEVEIVNNGYDFFEGMTTGIIIPVKQINAHLIKPSFFTLDESGEIGLKTLSHESRVEFYPINIIKESKEGMWITGIPDNTKIITAGQEFLRVGDKAVVAE
ncbi:MAG: hypothetical protein COV35_04860 [Alphaproteobacteria bacterium CG11_big_fil_rev_8_21_14_0_20_39_49]|nr:MAG: hypothetical protein COV35_04860 [Alphaproteobacteria bacterium CG11_big_fil_rev_8_21_14_0_20_39_49]